MPTRRAFTLVELTITLAIAAILAAIALPRMGDASGRRRTDLAIRRIDASLELARSLAFHASAAHTITFDAAADGYTLAGPAGAVERVSMADEPYRIDLDKFDLNADSVIVFDAFGVPDSGGTFWLRSPRGDEQYTISGETGRVVR